MGDAESWQVDDDVRLWLDPSGGITLKAVTADGDPVELSSRQARDLAGALIEVANRDDEAQPRQGTFLTTGEARVELVASAINHQPDEQRREAAENCGRK